MMALLGLFVWLSGIRDLGTFNRRCWPCGGAGAVIRVLSLGSEEARPVSIPCGYCLGRGRIPLVGGELDAAVWRISGALWACVAVALAGGLVWGMRLANCGLCGGSGCLALEAQPPGEAAVVVEVGCVACDGRGRLGALDRWVLRHEAS